MTRSTDARGGRFGRGHKVMALIPLAVLSVAWTASIATTGASTALADSTTDQKLPDGTSLPTEAIEVPASVSAAGGVAPGITGDVQQAVATASTSGIPAAALAAYQRAETVINSADPGCHLSWQLVAAIGRVESDHGRTNANTLDAQGVATPGIFGPPLNGGDGTSRISDTDAGQYDADSTWDRAVGPMQFIPSTWSVVGVDADGDGQRNPQDVDDAALATAVYLCSGGDDLDTTAGQRAAVYRYNHSQSYVDLVLSIMAAYLDGEFTSVPNGVTSAGYVIPQLPQSTGGGKGHPGKGHHGDNNGGDDNGGGSEEPTSKPTKKPTTKPSSQPTLPATTDGPKVPLPTLTLPPLPSTAITPVDQLLTAVQARAQCLLDGYDPVLQSQLIQRVRVRLHALTGTVIEEGRSPVSKPGEPRTAPLGARSAAQEPRGLARPVGEHDVGAGPPDRRQRLEDRGLAVDPAVGGGGLDHGVLAGDVVGRYRDVDGVAHLAQHVEVGQRGLHHHDVGALGDVQERLADAFTGVGGVLLVGAPVALERESTASRNGP
jgi:membrane-bound lytic murein transglycosylase B